MCNYCIINPLPWWVSDSEKRWLISDCTHTWPSFVKDTDPFTIQHRAFLYESYIKSNSTTIVKKIQNKVSWSSSSPQKHNSESYKYRKNNWHVNRQENRMSAPSVNRTKAARNKSLVRTFTLPLMCLAQEISVSEGTTRTMALQNYSCALTAAIWPSSQISFLWMLIFS
jgi:hypothetical protein